jgi:hypothetical protein
MREVRKRLVQPATGAIRTRRATRCCSVLFKVERAEDLDGQPLGL